MADVDDVGQCRRKPEPRGMDHARDAAAAADIKVAQAKVRRGVWQQELLVAFEFGEQRIGGHFDYLAFKARMRRVSHSTGGRRGPWAPLGETDAGPGRRDVCNWASFQATQFVSVLHKAC